MGSHRVGHNLAPKQQQCVCGERSLLQVLGYKLFFASLSERGHEVPKLLAYCFWCLTQNPSGFPERSRKINLNLSISNCWKTRVNESFLNFFTAIISSYGIVQFSSVHSLSRVQLFATPWITARQASLPVHHQLPEFTQTYVHQVGDAIQPSHPLSSPSPAANPSQHQGLLQWVNSSHEVTKVLDF